MVSATRITFPAREIPDGSRQGVRVLLAVDDVPARLTLEAVLAKSGFAVDSAASAAEAMDLIEREPYALVLCNLGGESRGASRGVIRLARRQAHRPATAYLMTAHDHSRHDADTEDLLIEPVDIPSFLTHVAELLANRAVGRAERATRHLRSA